MRHRGVQSQSAGAQRHHGEINLLVADPDQLSERAIAVDMAMVRLPLLAV